MCGRGSANDNIFKKIKMFTIIYCLMIEINFLISFMLIFRMEIASQVKKVWKSHYIGKIIYS